MSDQLGLDHCSRRSGAGLTELGIGKEQATDKETEQASCRGHCDHAQPTDRASSLREIDITLDWAAQELLVNKTQNGIANCRSVRNIAVNSNNNYNNEPDHQVYSKSPPPTFADHQHYCKSPPHHNCRTSAESVSSW